MTDTTVGGAGRRALIFGARNLGRAIIETLVAQGWAVAGAARSDETLAAVTAAGALALRSDITDQAAVRATVEAAARSPMLLPTRSTAGRSRRRARRSRSSRARAARSRRWTGR